ncbi:protein of unknown function [Streptomyces sp. KY75]|nr:protein of unknown function [Streptomyces sp. KY75]CAD5994376.1 protein of unknown function [Streptomyces sp. KY70]
MGPPQLRGPLDSGAAAGGGDPGTGRHTGPVTAAGRNAETRRRRSQPVGPASPFLQEPTTTTRTSHLLLPELKELRQAR